MTNQINFYTTAKTFRYALLYCHVKYIHAQRIEYQMVYQINYTIVQSMESEYIQIHIIGYSNNIKGFYFGQGSFIFC